MVKEAEEFADEDKNLKERVDARNGLEGYAYNMRNQINDEEKIGGKISDEDKETIEEAVTEAIDWLNENPEADAEEYKEKQTELEGTCNPIVQKLTSEGGGEDDEFGEDGDDDLGDNDDL